MNWIQDNPRSALLCGLTLLAPVALWLYLVLLLWGMRAEYVQQMDYLQPRIARLQGLIDFQPQLQSASEQATALVAQLVIPAGGDLASESAALQREVRQLFADAGMSVSNSQVASVSGDELLDRLSINLRVDGDLDALQQALYALAEQEPVLFVESLEVRPLPARRGESDSRQLTASLQIQVLRSKQ